MNIAQSRLNKRNFINIGFVSNTFVMILQNLTPFSLERKLNNIKDQKFVQFMWEKCMSNKFH